MMHVAFVLALMLALVRVCSANASYEKKCLADRSRYIDHTGKWMKCHVEASSTFYTSEEPEYCCNRLIEEMRLANAKKQTDVPDKHTDKHSLMPSANDWNRDDLSTTLSTATNASPSSIGSSAENGPKKVITNCGQLSWLSFSWSVSCW